jgi:signal transduction histidine kinase
VNRLGPRILLAMLAVALVSLSVVPIAQIVAERATLAQLPTAFRERVLEETRPQPFFGGPHRAPGMIEDRVPGPGDPTLRQEVARLFVLLGDFRTAQRRAVIGGVAVALVVCLALAWWLSRTIARPLEAVSDGASQLARGALGTRVDLPGRRFQPVETRELADDFNAMAASLEGLEGERRAMIADIAHELRTPLAALSMRLDAIQDGLVAFDRAEVALLRRHADLLARLIDDLRLLSLADAGRLRLAMQRMDLGAWLPRAASSYDQAVTRGGAELEVVVPPHPVPVRADPQRLQQILQNLLDNAGKVTPEGGTVTVSIEAERDRAVLRVRDEGPGIPEDELDTIFERFVQGRRRDAAGNAGSGLGLAIVRTLVRLHGGAVAARNWERGAEMTVRLPLEVDASHASSSGA